MGYILKDILKLFGLAFSITLFTVGAGLSGYVQLFFSSTDPFLVKIQSLGWSGLIITVLISVIVGLLFSVIKSGAFVAETYPVIEKPDATSIYEALKNELEKSLLARDYNTVIRLGSAISRVLWIAGQYKYRIAIGDLIFEAACKLDDKEQMARVQIDDIGWTHFVIGNSDEAKTTIKSGLECANGISNHYLAAKAYRHLASIDLSIGDITLLVDANQNLTDAKDAALAIPIEHDKKEMLLGVGYAQVELLVAKSKSDPAALDKALTISNDVLKGYDNLLDEERKAKSYSQKGKILFIKEDLRKAIAAFNSGLGVAERVNRQDELMKCNMGLAVAYHKMGKQDARNKHLAECRKQPFDEITFAFWGEIFDVFQTISQL